MLTAYKDRLGLTLEYSVEELLARSIAFKDLLPERSLHGGHHRPMPPKIVPNWRASTRSSCSPTPHWQKQLRQI
jgi:hypothetical protein